MKDIILLSFSYDRCGALHNKPSCYVKKYGFLKKSTTSIYDNNPYFNTELVVKSDDLIKALQDFYLLGKLKFSILRQTHTIYTSK